ncbi:MAG TPA: DUF222 domain-containing protein [Aeromicrobium sp.]|nr:DUF222 domain-containing protein [Aeromicrobium sp.]
MIDQTAPTSIEVLERLERMRAIAEAEAWSAMLRFEDEQTAAAQHEPTPIGTLIARASIPGDIGQAMGLSENQVKNRLHTARTIRSRTPRVWLAFQSGRVDTARLHHIAHTITILREPESVTQLDARVVDYACTHTTAELKRWLRDFVQRVEADHATARADHERNQRFVKIDHGDDAMSWLTAYLPSPAAAAIERRLHQQARALTGDGRTLAQREADLLTSWLTTTDTTGEAAVHADIAVVVDADVLAGARPGFATAADGSWTTPAAWITHITHHNNPFWWRMIRQPVTDNILAIEYHGRYAPKLLRQALQFQHPTCIHPGCLVPAWKCDLDHETPWPHGPTRGDNLTPKSRAHHALKGHGFSPPRPRRPPEEVALPLTDVRVELLPSRYTLVGPRGRRACERDRPSASRPPAG